MTHRSRNLTIIRTVFAGILVATLWESTAMAEPSDPKAKTAALNALVRFMDEWNTGDDARLRTAMHFPFVNFGGGARVKIDETPEGFSQGFEQMRTGDGWASSTFDYDSIEYLYASPEKVHLTVSFNRLNAQGRTYMSGRVFYVVTNKDDRWAIQMRAGAGNELSGDARDATISEARNAVLGYMDAFNAADGPRSSEHLNYPHLFMMRGGVSIADPAQGGSADPNFEQMRSTQGWHFSSLDSFEPKIVTQNTVYWNVIFSRWHPDGTRYWTVPALWITTKVEGHWGIQLRSLMPATFDD